VFRGCFREPHAQRKKHWKAKHSRCWGKCRDRLRSSVLEGQLKRQRAYAGARAKIGERMITEQQAVISNLWHVFALAGLSPAKVRAFGFSLCCSYCAPGPLAETPPPSLQIFCTSYLLPLPSRYSKLRWLGKVRNRAESSMACRMTRYYWATHAFIGVHMSLSESISGGMRPVKHGLFSLRWSVMLCFSGPHLTRPHVQRRVAGGSGKAERPTGS